jgi:hypothetical protein
MCSFPFIFSSPSVLLGCSFIFCLFGSLCVSLRAARAADLLHARREMERQGKKQWSYFLKKRAGGENEGKQKSTQTQMKLTHRKNPPVRKIPQSEKE